MDRSIRLASLLGLVVAVGCNGSTEDTDTDSATATESSNTDATTGKSTGTDGTSGTDGSGSTGTGAEFVPIPARDIVLERVQAAVQLGLPPGAVRRPTLGVLQPEHHPLVVE